MSELKMSISVTDTDKVRTLIDLLAKYQDELPKPLVGALHNLADCDACEIDRQWLISNGFKDPFTNSLGIDRIVQINPVLKRLAVIGDGYQYPESFTFWADGKQVVSW